MASPRSLVWHEENRSDEDLPASKQFYKKKKEKRETKKKRNSNGRFNCRELYTSRLF